MTNRLTRHLAAAVATAALTISAPLAFAANNTASVQGVVKNAAGQPVVGAFVRLRSTPAHLTFMVVSQAKGVFTASGLPDGQYTVQGIGGEFQSAVSAPLSVVSGKSATIDVALSAKRGPMLSPAWPGKVTEVEADKISTNAKDLPAGDGQALTAEKCTLCHDVQRIMAKRSLADEWAHTIERMRGSMVAASLPDLSDAEAAAIAKYVSTHFPALPGSDDINARLPRTLASGKGMGYRAVTLDMPKRFSEPHDVAADPTGVVWAAERAGRLIRFDPKTLDFSERNLPPGPAAENRQRLGNPQIDSKGILWAADGPNNRWLSYDTAKRQFHAFPWNVKGHGGAGGNSMAIDPDGTIWETGNREIRMLDPATAEFKFFKSPNTGSTNPGAYGMAIAGDGTAWWAEDGADMMARANPKTGKVEEFKIPFNGHAYPRRMNSDWDGNLWVGLWNAGRLMKVDYKTAKMTLYTPPTPNAGNYSVVADKKNHLIWVSEQEVDKIARFDPKTEEWTEFPVPYAQSDTRRIDIDPTNPNRIFFSGNTADRIGFIEVLP